ncbi:hypothetical protein M1D34_26700 (plasmid) [Ensifer sp. D2-11]
MELTARLGSMMPYRQAATVLAEFLPVEPTETHATVRKRTIRIGERLDDQIAQEERRAGSHQTDERRQLEMHLPGDRRKEFVISIDTAHVRSADPNSARNCDLVVARCGRGGRGETDGRYFVTGSTDQQAIRDRTLHALRREGYCGFVSRHRDLGWCRNPQAAAAGDAEADSPHPRLVPHRHEDPAHAADRRSPDPLQL